MQPNETAVATVQPSQAPALYFGDDLSNMTEVMSANMGPNAMFGFKDIKKIQFPGAGSLAWNIPGLDKPLIKEELEGVILAWQEHRGFFKTGYEGGNEPPDCFAEQPLPGAAMMGSKPVTKWQGQTFGGACAACPVGQWRLENGNKIRPACRPRVRVYIQTRDLALPVWIDLPSTSMPHFMEYMKALTQFKMPHYRVVTIFGLERAESLQRGKDGKTRKIPYAVLKLRALRSPDNSVFQFSAAEMVDLAPWRATVQRMIDPAQRAAARATITEDDAPPASAAAAFGMDDDEAAAYGMAEEDAAITADM